VSDRDRTSAWLTAPRELVLSLRKLAETETPAYHAHKGVYVSPYGVYWIRVDGSPDREGRVPITNLHDAGRSPVPLRYGRVEQELVHPLLRGRDVARWHATPSCHILFVQDPHARRGIAEEVMRTRYPATFEFLSSFEAELRSSAAFRRYYTRRNRSGAIVETGPYWSMFDVGDYTLAPHRVVWREQTTDFTAAVVPVADPIPIPNHKTILIACGSEDEAHYLCAALNSLPVRLFVSCYAVETQISTHTVEYTHFPKFDPENGIHRALAQASKVAHAAAAQGAEPDEEAVDRAAAQLWDLTGEELEAMRRFLDQLRKRDLVAA
jgi:hypothetical protein